MWNAISFVQNWTRVAVSMSNDDNHYTTGTPITLIYRHDISFFYFIKNILKLKQISEFFYL